jgi:hypothetical protein
MAFFSNNLQDINDSLFSFKSFQVLEDAQMLTTIFLGLYLILYVQRHEYIRKFFSWFGIDWERKLFDDILL